MDPLSDVLSLLKPRSCAAAAFDLGGDWSIQFPEHDGIKCYAITSGEGWLSVSGVDDPVHMAAGECLLLPSGRSFCCASDLSLIPVPAETFYATVPAGGVNLYNGGGGACGIVGNFELTGPHADMLLGVLPPIVHIKKESDKETLRWSIERMMQELRNPQPGGALILENLANVILAQTLRLHLSEGLRGSVGWLFALADKQMSIAINAMHNDPAHRWTLEELASHAGMSRSAFATKFKTTVGSAPMDYLTRWRMLLAGDQLINSNKSISTISLSLGYESESAFSTAFKRIMGCSPRQYSRAALNQTAE